ncbi:LOW QUALITY PROTEIN: C2 calcium-dependent domain-containing protein 6 [Tupaia chinensis]|uniref:LOW QUALITY PROTEIN: C2 calcium-dependent domain-containing protein 6 n=1 Tax=Tupaia chinensis TaxID=246437 RepID=UPI000704377F|nr:LOW QUALITY PROTEIN: C2 calcium-dependent domain-containing protein 6 [Tupaia chinensis]
MEPIHNRLSIATDNRTGPVQPLFTSVLHKGLHGGPDVTHARGSEYSSVRSTQHHGKGAPSKDKEQEGTGTRLLNMLRKTLKESDSEEVEVAPEIPSLVAFGNVAGCLAVHIKSCRYFTTKINLQHYTRLFIRITVNNIVKCTKTSTLQIRDSGRNTMIKFDEVKYFSVQVPRRQDDERNNVALELMQYDDTEKYPTLLGSVQIHLYEIIQKGCFTEDLKMTQKNTLICSLEVEFMFSYGNFGYGFSHQLKPLQKIIEPPMFMNIAPPPERTDPVTNVIIPQPVQYPAFLSPDLNVTIGTADTLHRPNQPSLVRLEKLQEQPRQRLEKMKKEYRNLGTWIEKASYLEQALTPKLEHSDIKESNSSEIFGSLDFSPSEERFKHVSSDVTFKSERMASTSSELLDSDEKKELIVPTLSHTAQDHLTAVLPKSDDSTVPHEGSSFGSIPSLEITEESKISPLDEYQSEAVPDRKSKMALFPPEVKMKEKHPSILKTDISASEVGFTWTEYSPPPSFRSEYIQVEPRYQKFNYKAGFDPFLRNLNKTMSDRKRKDQDIYQCGKFLSAEVIEHEDQDPPYPARSTPAGSTDKTWAYDPNIIAIKTSDTKDKSAREPSIITIKTSDTKNKSAQDPPINPMTTSDTKNKLADVSIVDTIKTSDSKTMSASDPTVKTTKTLDPKKKLSHDPGTIPIKSLDNKNELNKKLQNASLPSFKRESSVTENVNTCCLSKSLNLTSHIEDLRQSMVLKSILNKNLQDLSDKLFSKPEVYINTEATKKSSSPLLSIHDKPSSSTTEEVFEKIQDLSNWLSEKDILNSKSLLSQIIKNISEDSLSKGRSKTSLEKEDYVSEKHLEADEIDLPMEKKSSFKRKHSGSEVGSSKSGVNGMASDYIIKQIFTAPIFSKLDMALRQSRETQEDLQDPTLWERSLPSHVLVQYEEKDEKTELPQPKSVVSQIIQAFPIDTLLESGMIKVIELNKEYQESSSLDTKIGFPEESPVYSTDDYSGIRSKTEALSQQYMPIPQEATSSVSRIEFIEEDQNMFLQDSKYHPTPGKNTDLPRNRQRLGEEDDLSSILENLGASLMGKLNESDAVMFKSFLKNIFNIFFKYNQSERRQPEKELESLIRHSFPHDTEHLEEIQMDFDKAEKLDRKPSLSPKLRVFLEELSESEVKNLKSELSKHIQHYLVERLSESGHILKEDLPKIYQNLYLMNEKAEPKGQSIFQEKYSETIKEIMSFINNFNHHFIDKHLEIKLRSFLNDILQNYFLKNLSKSSLFNETESETTHSNISSLRTKSSSIPFHGLGQDISRGSFGGRLEINMKYPLSKSLQNCLSALSENELLNLKADLSKHLQCLFIEKLSKSGVMTESQLEGINQHIRFLNSSPTQLKCIKTDSELRDENHFMEKHSEKQNNYSKDFQKNSLQRVPMDTLIETELIRNEEKEYFSLHNLKENPSVIRKQNTYFPKEGPKTVTLIKVQPSSNKVTQAIPFIKPVERLPGTLLKNQRRDHGFVQLSCAENSVYKTEIPDPYNWGGKSKITQSKACFERMLKMKSLEKQEHINIYKWTVQEKPEAVLSPCIRTQYNCTLQRDDEEYLNRLPFPSWQSLHPIKSEMGMKPKLEDQYYQRLKGNNNNNKKHLVTFAQYKKEMHTPSIKPNENFYEKCARVPELQSFKYKVLEDEKNSKPFFFPEVLTRENLKSKIRKERDHVPKPKKSFNKIVRILPTTLPATRIHLRKSVPKTLLHWTARRTIHDCSDKFEEFPVTSFKQLKKVKSRAKMLGKNADDSYNQTKHSMRPYTAPEVNKRRESATGKLASPRMVSAGLVHVSDTNSDYDMRKMRPKKIKRGYGKPYARL